MPLEQLRPPLLRVYAPEHSHVPARSLVVLAACLAAGCAELGADLGHPAAAVVDKNATASLILTDDLQLMDRLIKGSTSEKAELFAHAKQEYDSAGTNTHKLRLALALATPGHPASSPADALHMLQDLLVNPEGLVPGERALAQVEMKQIDDYLSLQAKIDKLSSDAARAERLTAQIRHLQTESDERLRDLNEAKAKLEAILKIEKTLSERGTRKPNSEGPPQ
jgi:hypothetical protein